MSFMSSLKQIFPKRNLCCRETECSGKLLAKKRATGIKEKEGKSLSNTDSELKANQEKELAVMPNNLSEIKSACNYQGNYR